MLAGMNRKRKNAVNKDVSDMVVSPVSTITQGGKRARGRPSKGGEAMRAKRYYVKKHLLILQKRKLRRYVLKVKKILADKKYDAAAVKSDLDESFHQYHTRDNKSVSYNDILQVAELAREDRYLEFLNQDSIAVLNSLPLPTTTSSKNKNNDIDHDNDNDTEQQQQQQQQQDQQLQEQHGPAKIEKLMASLANKHSGRLFQLTTLWSAYLLLHFVEKEYQEKGLDLNEQERLEKIAALCLDYYEIDYSHLKGEELPDNLLHPDLFEQEEEKKDEKQQEEQQQQVTTKNKRYTNKKSRKSSCGNQQQDIATITTTTDEQQEVIAEQEVVDKEETYYST